MVSCSHPPPPAPLRCSEKNCEAAVYGCLLVIHESSAKCCSHGVSCVDGCVILCRTVPIANRLLVVYSACEDRFMLHMGLAFTVCPLKVQRLSSGETCKLYASHRPESHALLQSFRTARHILCRFYLWRLELLSSPLCPGEGHQSG